MSSDIITEALLSNIYEELKNIRKTLSSLQDAFVTMDNNGDPIYHIRNVDDSLASIAESISRMDQRQYEGGRPD